MRFPIAMPLGIATVLLLILDAGCARSPQHLQADLVVRNVTLIDVVAGVSRPGTDVVIRDGVFVAVADTGNEVPEGAVVVDAADAFAMPGLAELANLVKGGLTPLEAIRAGSVNAARMLGLEDEFGSVEVGKRADLVILDADPLQDIRNSRRIRAVIARGRIPIYRRRLTILFLIGVAHAIFLYGGDKPAGRRSRTRITIPS